MENYRLRSAQQTSSQTLAVPLIAFFLAFSRGHSMQLRTSEIRMAFTSTRRKAYAWFAILSVDL